MNTFITSGPTCAASTECISGEGCNSDGVCGTYIYSICLWNFCYITKELFSKQMYHIESTTRIFNPDYFMSSDPTCAASTECISGEGCNSDAVCGKYIYWLGL